MDIINLEESHQMFVNTGYNGDLEMFKVLMRDNPEALDAMYGLYVEAGYRESKDAYAELIGAKPPATVESAALIAMFRRLIGLL
jgi:hypothetical protein